MSFTKFIVYSRPLFPFIKSDMKKTTFFSACLSILWIYMLLLLPSCNDNDPEVVPEESIQSKVVKDFYLADLKELLKNNNLPDITGFIDGNTDEIRVQALKVSCKSGHPDGSADEIDLSGILLLPHSSDRATSYPQIIAPPFTYTLNAEAPSIQYASDDVLQSLKEYLVCWTMVAADGYVVIIPDYPGFGDSHGQCFTPYVEAKPLVRTTLDFIMAADQVAGENGYVCRPELDVCGYSQGAYVAASLARELETNASHGYTVDLLMIGGTPCNLLQIAGLAMASDVFSPSYFLPYAIWGYKKNGYPDLNIAALLLEPYAGNSFQYFDGFYPDIDHAFPEKTAELYTEAFRQGDQAENSLKPWKNRCEFLMIHGMEDRSVYFQNAKDYAEEHRSAGGTVTFTSVPGDHGQAGTAYFLQVITRFIILKN